MKTLYVCTLGTSIAKCSKEALKELQKANLPWDADPKPPGPNCKMVRELRQATGDAVQAAASPKAKSGDVKRASAELQILSQCGLSSSDRVVLLATDTFLGKFAAEQLRKVVAGHFKLSESDVVIRRIKGLQVNDAERLEKFGFGNFIDTTRKAIENGKKEGFRVVLCPNGGFKGVVPFLTILGMLYQCQTVYTFEFAETKLILPYLPFTFDRSLYRRAANALKELDEKIEMHRETFLGLIDGYEGEEADLFLGFVQQEGEMVTPSPLLEKFITAADAAETCAAMLSPAAVEDLKKFKGEERDRFETLILNAQNRDWLNSGCHYHTLKTTDLVVVKTGHCSNRLLGFCVKDRFYVARAVLHDEYETLMNKKSGNPRRKDFPPDAFILWRPEGAPETARENRLLASLRKENAELSDRVVGLPEKAARAEKQAEDARAGKKAARREADAARREADAARADAEAARRDADSLRVRLKNADREADEARAARCRADAARKEAEAALAAFRARPFLRRLKDLFRPAAGV